MKLRLTTAPLAHDARERLISTFFSVLIALILLGFVGGVHAQDPDPNPPAQPAPTDPANKSPAAGVEPTATPAVSSPETPDVPPSPRRSRRSSRSGRGNMVVIGAPVTVKSGDTIRELVAIGSDVRIDGTVDRELVTLLGRTTLGPTARVDEIVVIGGSFEADPAADLGRDPVIITDPWMVMSNAIPPVLSQALLAWVKTGPMQGRPLPLPHESGWAWVVAGCCLLLYLLVELLFPKAVRASAIALEERPGSAFLAGLLGLVLTLPLLALLAVTVIGLPVIPFAAAGLAGLLVVGKAGLYRHAGAALATRARVNFLADPLPALVLGAAVFFLLYCVPILGGIVWAFAVALGFGAASLAALGRARKKTPSGGEASPAQGTGGAAFESAPALESQGSIPMDLRAGFWRRMWAVLLDLILIFLILFLAPIDDRPRWFLPVWLFYHLAFWMWRGTTIGGIICGLRIVCLDGQPLSPGVAIVRLLGSFFSLAVAGLGFFWAGWSAEKQSWHDKIAGTVVIRAPSEQSLRR